MTYTTINTSPIVDNKKYLPNIYVIVEDQLAELVVQKVFKELSKSTIMCIRSGSWMNQMACLYGFFTCQEVYKQQGYIRDFKEIMIVGIIDGDINEKSIKENFSKTIRGNYFPYKELKNKVKNSVVSFELEITKCDEVEKGLPEYNHKKWFEEISDDDIKLYYSKENELEKYLNDSGNKIIEKEKVSLESVIKLQNIKVEHIKKCINYSKKLKIKNKDFHSYYKKMSKVIESAAANVHNKSLDSTMSYILNWIQMFNKEKWDKYTEPVKKRLIELIQKNCAQLDK